MWLGASASPTEQDQEGIIRVSGLGLRVEDLRFRV